MLSRRLNASLSLILSLLLSQLAPISANASSCSSSSFSAGTGTQEQPYEIANEANLLSLSNCLGPSFDATYFRLTADISLSTTGTGQLPIGDLNNPFQGQIDGQNHSLFIGNLSKSVARSGLFGVIKSSSIEHLSISGSVISATDAGLLAGRAELTNLRGITALTRVDGSTRAGGLVGELIDSTIENVVVFSSPLINTTYYVRATGSGGGFAGGLAGRAQNTTFSNIVSSVSVQASGNTSLPSSSVGGLVGSGTGLHVQLAESFGAVAASSTHIGNVGGLVGRLDGSVVERSRAEGAVSGKYAGGLIGYMESSEILFSHAVGDVTGPVTTMKGGGLIGWVTSPSSLSQTSARGDVQTNGSSAGNMGGLIGESSANSLSVVDSYAAGTVSSGGGGAVGGAFGQIGTAVIERVFALGTASGGSSRFPFVGGGSGTRTASSNFFLSANLAADDSSGTPVLAQAANQASFSDIATFQQAGFSIQLFSQTQGASTIWLMCDSSPILTSEPAPDSCPMYPVSGILDSSGQLMTLRFNGEISELPDKTAFATTPSVAIASIATTSARVLQVQLSSALPGSVDLAFSYMKPSDPGALLLKRSGADSEAESFTYRGLINNSTLSGPVVSNLASSNLAPTSFDLSFTCGGSCDPSASYDYVASVTPAGGSATTQTATTTGTATLSFNNLDPNVAHVISVTVTQGGLTSPAATLNVTTPKPVATISALSVLDTSATLTVGCTNCGAAPDSFTVSATPVAGGAAITSNTNVLTSLSPETTYSFSVVVAFAGTTSDLVFWQDNPVMTLPLVPVISAVSPAAVPLSGGTITVTGANFTTSSLLTLGGTSSAFTIVSGTEITFTAPSGTAGSFDLAITNPVGTFTLSSAITYVSGPTLTTNSPVLATTNGGTIVTLTGTDLATTNQVNVGSTTVSFSVISNTVVRFTTAATTAGVVDVGVVTVGGAATISSAIEFTTSALVPVISTITPVTGPTAGGTTITVTGQYFTGSYSDSVSAAINGISGSSVVLIDDSTLTFVSPPGAAATGLDVTVATGGGLGTLAGAFTYTAPPAPQAPTTAGSAPPVVINTPTITEFSTREISASGAEVTATGQRLENVSVLTLGGITVTIVSNTSTSLTFTTGEMPVGVWDLRLVGSNGTLVFQQAIEVVEASAIVAESTGELLGYTWTLKFIGNSRSLHSAQREHLAGKLDDYSTAETIICWGYTTAANPNDWAIAHATQRAQAACDLAIANNSEAKTVVRLRYGVSKSWAMRSALQFWR